MNIAFKQIWELGCEAWPNVSELVLLKTGPRSLSKGYGREAEGVFVICHLVNTTGLFAGSYKGSEGNNRDDRGTIHYYIVSTQHLVTTKAKRCNILMVKINVSYISSSWQLCHAT
uniref:Uncharacterized protein n=1 Tax=Brassica oleracea var. oleracea TaxID=109376 RepID=A0A0D3DX32_BRAOL